MTPSLHVHTPGDGRGIRDVFVDGELVKFVFYADTRKGFVRYYLNPLKIHKHGKRCLSRTLRGRVDVRYRELNKVME